MLTLLRPWDDFLAIAEGKELGVKEAGASGDPKELDLKELKSPAPSGNLTGIGQPEVLLWFTDDGNAGQGYVRIIQLDLVTRRVV